MHEAAESIPARVWSLAAPRTDLGGDTDALDWRSDERREVLPTRWPSCPGVVAVSAASAPYCDIDVTVL
jgi:hypothetical protein